MVEMPSAGEPVEFELRPDICWSLGSGCVPMRHSIRQGATGAVPDERAHLAIEAESGPDVRDKEGPQRLTAPLTHRYDGVRCQVLAELDPGGLPRCTGGGIRLTVQGGRDPGGQVWFAAGSADPDVTGENDELRTEPIPPPQLASAHTCPKLGTSFIGHDAGYGRNQVASKPTKARSRLAPPTWSENATKRSPKFRCRPLSSTGSPVVRPFLDGVMRGAMQTERTARQPAPSL